MHGDSLAKNLYIYTPALLAKIGVVGGISWPLDDSSSLIQYMCVYIYLNISHYSEVNSRHCIDVTIPLQSLVKDSQIILTESKTKVCIICMF